MGRVTGSLDERSIRLLGRVDSPAEFANLVITERNSRLVRLGEVANVRDATEEPRTLSLYGDKGEFFGGAVGVRVGNALAEVGRVEHPVRKSDPQDYKPPVSRALVVGDRRPHRRPERSRG